MKIEVKRLQHAGYLPLPERHSEGAAGYDLRAAEGVNIANGEQALIKTGFAWAIPPGYVGLIKDRSSMALKRRLVTHAGVIDSDYRGDVGVILSNESDKGVTIEAGERIAQMLIVPVVAADLEEVDELDATDRGAGGYGSTGK